MIKQGISKKYTRNILYNLFPNTSKSPSRLVRYKGYRLGEKMPNNLELQTDDLPF